MSGSDAWLGFVSDAFLWISGFILGALIAGRKAKDGGT